MIRERVKSALVVGCIGMFAIVTWARPALVAKSSMLVKPAFMDRYSNDPYAKAELRGKCTVCHIGRGGGERNDFGEAFEDAGYRITPKLRAKFPGLFERTPRTEPTVKPSASADQADSIHGWNPNE